MSSCRTISMIFSCGFVCSLVWNSTNIAPSEADARQHAQGTPQIQATASDRSDTLRETRRGKAVAALCAALQTNIDYCQQWLDSNDFASLSKTTRGLVLLSELLKAESQSEEWREQISALQAATTSLLQAAAGEDEEACSKCIQTIRTAAAQLANIEYELADDPTYARANDIDRTMDLLDATYADAKRALLFDEVANAQREAFVLWSLGEYLKSQDARGTSDERWHQLAGEFSQAALRAAELAEPKSQDVSAALKLAREECERCHNRE